MGVEQSMWQAPALTVAAQAFLLRVLTDDSVNSVARGFILAAGIVASLAALSSLVRLRSREVLYSEAFAHYFGKFGLPEARPHDKLPRRPLPETAPRKRRVLSIPWDTMDKRLQQWAEGWRFPMYAGWGIALLLFIVADVVAFLLTV